MELKLKTPLRDGTMHLMMLPLKSMSQRIEWRLLGIQIFERYGSNGSASAGRPRDLTAGKLTPKLSRRIADIRGRQ